MYYIIHTCSTTLFDNIVNVISFLLDSKGIPTRHAGQRLWSCCHDCKHGRTCWLPSTNRLCVLKACSPRNPQGSDHRVVCEWKDWGQDDLYLPLLYWYGHVCWGSIWVSLDPSWDTKYCLLYCLLYVYTYLVIIIYKLFSNLMLPFYWHSFVILLRHVLLLVQYNLRKDLVLFPSSELKGNITCCWSTREGKYLDSFCWIDPSILGCLSVFPCWLMNCWLATIGFLFLSIWRPSLNPSYHHNVFYFIALHSYIHSNIHWLIEK